MNFETRPGDDPAPARAAGFRIGRWRHDPHLASVRDPDALRVMEPELAAEWRRLWTDVDAAIGDDEGP
jgi:hypothetical protein